MVAAPVGAGAQDAGADRGLYAAEEAADNVVHAILTKGGHALYGRYLRSKTVEFVADAAAEAGLSSLRMCFVQHEDLDGAEDWALDEEPALAGLDSWAGMAVPIRYVPNNCSAAGRSISSKRPKGRTLPRARARTKPNVLEVPMGVRRATSSPGMTKDVRRSIIRGDCPRDDLEEELRALKARKAVFRMQLEESERQRMMEEQERRSMLEQEPLDDDLPGPCNVDEEGNVIFVGGIPPEKLADVQTVPSYDLYQRARRDAAFNLEGAAQLRSKDRLSRPHTSPASMVRPVHGTRQQSSNATQRPVSRQASRKAEPAVFTDSFEKMEAAQPPMHEIMSVEAGVTLDCDGVKKAGAQPAAHGRMSRQEYARLCDRDLPEKDSAVKKVQSGSRPASPEALPGEEPQEEDQSPTDRTPNHRRQQLRPYLQPGLGAGGPTTPDHSRLQPRQYSQAPGFGATRPATAPAPISTTTTPAGGTAGGVLMPPGAVQREMPSPSASGARPMLPSGVRRSDPESPTAAWALQSRPASGKQGNAPGFWPKGWEDSTPIRAPRSASAAAAVQRAPAAPSWELRARQSRASLGSKPPPRYHAPQLGGSQLVGLPQPPPGATMGHGLLRSGSRNEFFYPMAQSAPRTSAAPLPGGPRRQSSGGASRLTSGRPSPASAPAREDSGGLRAAAGVVAAAG